MPQGEWTLIVCDGSGNTLTELTRAQGTHLSFKRNWYPECSFSLSHGDDECAAILEAMAAGTGGGMPTLKGYRTGSDGTRTLRFNGYLATVDEEAGLDASMATFTFKGPFGRLIGEGSNRGRFTSTETPPAGGSWGPFVATDAGDIAEQLIVATHRSVTSFDSSTTGVGLNGTIEPTKARDRSYPLGQNVGEAIVNLTNVLDGFDFEIEPTSYIDVRGYELGDLNIYAKQGTDKPTAKFEYGPATLANCAGTHRQTLPPINYVTVYGANGLHSTKFDVTSVRKYGRFEHIETQTDVSEQATLDDKAQALLRPNPVKTIGFTPDLSIPSCPQPFDDYDLGDTGRFYANSDSLQEGPVAVRINQFEVVIDPNTGREVTEIPDPTTADDDAVIRAGLQTEVATGAVL